MLWITPIAECSIFNSMQPKFYEVMLATSQTAHLINIGLSINSLINCYHSRAWKIHQQVHGSPWKWDSLPHSAAVVCRRLPSPRLAAGKFTMLGVLIWLLRVSFPHWFLVVLLQFCFLFLDFSHKWLMGVKGTKASLAWIHAWQLPVHSLWYLWVGFVTNIFIAFHRVWYLRAWVQTKQAYNCKSRTRAGLRHMPKMGRVPYFCSPTVAEQRKKTNAPWELWRGYSKGEFIHMSVRLTLKLVFRIQGWCCGIYDPLQTSELEHAKMSFLKSCSQPFMWFIIFFLTLEIS